FRSLLTSICNGPALKMALSPSLDAMMASKDSTLHNVILTRPVLLSLPHTIGDRNFRISSLKGRVSLHASSERSMLLASHFQEVMPKVHQHPTAVILNIFREPPHW